MASGLAGLIPPEQPQVKRHSFMVFFRQGYGPYFYLRQSHAGQWTVKCWRERRCDVKIISIVARDEEEEEEVWCMFVSLKTLSLYVAFEGLILIALVTPGL